MNVILRHARMAVHVSITESIIHVIVRMVIRARTANLWLIGAVVVEVYHNPVKMEQPVNKFRTYTSAFVNPVGRARCVT